MPFNTLYPISTAPPVDPAPTQSPTTAATGDSHGTGPSIPHNPPPTVGPGDYLPIPEAAKQNTPEGAVAFVQFFYDEINRAYKDPTKANIKRLCTDGAPVCGSMQEEVDNLQRSGETAASNYLAYRSLQAGPIEDGLQKVGAQVKTLEFEIVRGGVPVRRSPGEPETVFIEGLIWSGSGWRLALHGKPEK